MLRTSTVALLLGLAAATATLPGCAADETLTAEVIAPDDDGKADASNELRVRAGETTVWFSRALERRGDLLVLRGRTSRTITEGFGFIWDDPYGDFASRGPRSFELTWPASTARGLVDGVNQFVRLAFAPGGSSPGAVTARVIVRPRLGNLTGSSRIYLTAELTPVLVAGRTVYRVSGHGVAPVREVEARGAGGSPIAVTILGEGRFALDLEAEQVFALAGVPGATLSVSQRDASGAAPWTKQASLGLALRSLGVTTGDVEEVWPSPTCTEPTLACLDALPDGTLDTASCGATLPVGACRGRIGVVIDDVAFAATSAAADARLADPAGFRADAPGLVGADRAEELQGIAGQVIDARLEQLMGRWLLDEAARTALLDGAVEGGLDEIYARPLEHFEPRPGTPGDAAATRQVVADGVLAYVATQDYAHSAFDRSLTELAHHFRARHVASIRAFRETSVAAVHYANPSWDIYLGDWLGAYTEVSVDRATGTVTNVLVELD